MRLYILSQAAFVFTDESNDYERDCLFAGLQKDLRGHPFQHSSWTGKSDHGAFQIQSAVSSLWWKLHKNLRRDLC